MSKMNGDKARFQKYRKRKVLLRQRVRALMTRLGIESERKSQSATTRAASLAMQDEGGPAGTND